MFAQFSLFYYPFDWHVFVLLDQISLHLLKMPVKIFCINITNNKIRDRLLKLSGIGAAEYVLPTPWESFHVSLLHFIILLSFYPFIIWFVSKINGQRYFFNLFCQSNGKIGNLNVYLFLTYSNNYLSNCSLLSFISLINLIYVDY